MHENAISTISHPDQFTHILHDHSSVLLHQGTAFKELLSLPSSIDTIDNTWDMQTYF